MLKEKLEQRKCCKLRGFCRFVPYSLYGSKSYNLYVQILCNTTI